PAVPPAERPPATAATAPLQQPIAASPGFAWEPFGYLRMQYIAVQDDPNVSYVGRDDGFEIQNARLGARGKLGERAAFGLSFDVAAQNGADEFSSNNDNNLLALSAAVLARLPHDTWIVAAGRWNPRTIGELPFRQDETDLQGSLGIHIGAGPVSIGGGAVFQHT